MRKPQTLLIDADDTLWENNIYFEGVIDAYCGLMEARGHPRAEARAALTAIERVRTRINGYGIKNFRASLRLACGELMAAADHERELGMLDEWCASLTRQSLALLPGVLDTVQELSGRHRLILFTKGDLDDQIDKVQRSGLRRYLHQIDVVREKDVDSYRDAVIRHGARLDRTWMIGNSPRSDIRPAVDAGLGAVFIPHHATWELELDETQIAPAPRLLVLERFDQLTKYF